MSGFLGVPIGAAYHLVFALTQLLTPVAGGLAAAAAIVLFTAAVRLALSPLSLRALRGQAAMARLAPQVQALRTRYGRQPERFSSELTALYKREGASPFAGFLPLLAQWPFLSVMYLLFRSATVDGTQNKLLSDGLFGVPLGAHWLSGAGLLSAHDALFLAVFALLGALCWLSARLARRTAPAAPSAPPAPAARRATQVPGGAGRAASGGTGQAARRKASRVSPGDRHPSRPRRGARRQQGGGRAHPGPPVPDRGHCRVRPAGRRHLPAHHRRLDPRRTSRLPPSHRTHRTHRQAQSACSGAKLSPGITARSVRPSVSAGS